MLSVTVTGKGATLLGEQPLSVARLLLLHAHCALQKARVLPTIAPTTPRLDPATQAACAPLVQDVGRHAWLASQMQRATSRERTATCVALGLKATVSSGWRLGEAKNDQAIVFMLLLVPLWEVLLMPPQVSPLH